MKGDPDNQKTPLAPRTIPKSHAPPSTPSKLRHEKADKSLVYILTFAVLVTLILLITFSIILRVTTPNLNLIITSLHLNNMTSSSSSLNITMLTDLTLSNRNHGPYTYEKSRGAVFHNDVPIGGGDVIGGRVGARSRKTVSYSMSFDSKKSNNTDLIEVFVSVKMSGRVSIMKLRNREKTVETSCTVVIDAMRESVTSLFC